MDLETYHLFFRKIRRRIRYIRLKFATRK
jgi:hypothetical protein